MIHILSPSLCASEAVREIQEIAHGLSPEQEDLLVKLLRQAIRDTYECSAQIAEDWVANHDRDEILTGEQVGDGIASCIRDKAEERKSLKRVAGVA